MDAPIARRAVDGFLAGYEKQAKKEEKEAKALIAGIDPDLLRALCTRYDNKTGEFPEHEHEGAAVLAFFMELKCNVEKKEMEEEMKKKDEIKADQGLKLLGVYPIVYHFETAVNPFTSITIVEDICSWLNLRKILDNILITILPTVVHEKATRLRLELVQKGIFGVSICDQRDKHNYTLGRTIAKGRLLKHLKAVGKEVEKDEEIEKKMNDKVMEVQDYLRTKGIKVSETKIADTAPI